MSRASVGLTAARRSRRAFARSRTAGDLAESTIEGTSLAVVAGCRAGLFIRMLGIDCGWVDAGGEDRRAGRVRMREIGCGCADAGGEECRAGLFIRMLKVDCGWIDGEGTERRAGLLIRVLEVDCGWVDIEGLVFRTGRFRLPDEIGCDWAQGRTRDRRAAMRSAIESATLG